MHDDYRIVRGPGLRGYYSSIVDRRRQERLFRFIRNESYKKRDLGVRPCLHLKQSEVCASEVPPCGTKGRSLNE